MVRLRTAPECRVIPGRRPNRSQALAAALLMVTLGLTCFAVCLWRWCFDLGLVVFFPFEDAGIARWQVWFGLGVALQLSASPLLRYSAGGPEPRQRPSMEPLPARGGR